MSPRPENLKEGGRVAYLKKVDKGWKIIIEIGTDPRTGKRKRKTRIVRDIKSEAEKVMADMIKQYENGDLLVDASNITFGEYVIYHYLPDKKNEVEYRTYKEYYNLCYKSIIPGLGKVTMKEIVKPYYVKKYLDGIRERGRLDGSGDLSERTLSYHYITINNILEHAVRYEAIQKNPCSVIKPPNPKKKKKEIVFLDFKEAKYVTVSLKDNWLYPLVFVDLNSGMRRGELAALQWSDIKFNNNLIHIQRSVYRKKGEGLKFKKTKRLTSMRTINVSPKVIAVLEEHREEQLKIKQSMEGYNPHDLVFPLENGNILDPDIITKRYKRAIKKLDIKPHTFNDLRHTHASLLLAKGFSMKVIQERLGHTSIETTQIYAHLIPGVQKEAAMALKDIFE